MRADVFINQTHVGVLERRVTDFTFVYLADYLEDPSAIPISYSFPLSDILYTSQKLFPFFEGLVSEGWLLRIQSQIEKIDERDYFRILIENGEDAVGAVTVKSRGNE